MKNNLRIFIKSSFLTSGIEPFYVGSLRTKVLDYGICETRSLWSYGFVLCFRLLSKCMRRLCHDEGNQEFGVIAFSCWRLICSWVPLLQLYPKFWTLWGCLNQTKFFTFVLLNSNNGRITFLVVWYFKIYWLKQHPTKEGTLVYGSFVLKHQDGYVIHADITRPKGMC